MTIDVDDLQESLEQADDDKSLTPEWRDWIEREVSRLEQTAVGVDGDCPA